MVEIHQRVHRNGKFACHRSRPRFSQQPVDYGLPFGGAAGAFGRIKILCDGAERRDLAEHLALEKQMMVASAASADAREGVRAFAEKRAPKFGA